MKIDWRENLARVLGLYIFVDCLYYLIGITVVRAIPSGDLIAFFTIFTSFCGMVVGILLVFKIKDSWFIPIVLIELTTCVYWIGYSLLSMTVTHQNNNLAHSVSSVLYDFFSCSMGVIACLLWFYGLFVAKFKKPAAKVSSTLS